jgi:hypothetical protein
MEADLLARLLAAPAVAALAGARGAWGGRPANNALPSFTLTLVAPGRGYTHDGADPLQGPAVQVDCWGDEPDDAKALADAIVAAVEPPATVGSTEFRHSFLTTAFDAPTEDLDAGVRVHRRVLQFTIWHLPAA